VTRKGSALAGRNASIVLPDPSHLSGNTSIVLLLTLLLFSTTISYIDRQALSIAAPFLRSRFNMSNLNYSEVLFAFLLAYALFHPIMGRFIDWIGTRLGMALAIIFWSVASMLHATASGMWSFGFFRFLLGIGEAGNFPGCIKVVAEQIPADFRALATGVFNAGAGVGAIIAAPLVAWLIIISGWRATFLITGSLGFLWVLAWLLLYRLTRRQPEGKSVGKAKTPNEGAAVLPWKTLLGYRQVRGLMLARFITDPAWYFYLFWLPEYLHSARGFSLQQIGHFAWIPFLTANVGSLAGGWINTFFMRRGWSLNNARKVAMAGSAACMPLAIAAAYVSDAREAIAFVSLATFGHQAWSANVLTLPADLFPSRVVGSVYGLSGSSGSFGGMVFMLVIGGVVDHFSYAPVFVTVGVMHPVATAVLFLAIRRIELVHMNQALPTKGGKSVTKWKPVG
jgi:ACS family hexuronate transporter-like MFS transporter